MDDAKRTTRIVYSCLRQVGVDPDTGAFDVDVIASGTSKSQRDRIKIVKEIIKSVGEKHPGGKAPLEEVYAEAQNQQIDRQHAEDLIARMRRSGDLIKPDKEHVKVV
jgi:replicative DNA helicase Mcm